jgi:SAM-dependent methyltransferase
MSVRGNGPTGPSPIERHGAGRGAPPSVGGMAPGRFDNVSAEYEAGRPDYPAGIYDRLDEVVGGLAGATVIEAGAGTGIASRQLATRGARLVSSDPSVAMLARARRLGAPPLVLADGLALPFRTGVADLFCVAQAWHWFEPVAAASAEAARVLRPGGHWAAWWSTARAEGEAWFDDQHALFAERCPGYHLASRLPDWVPDLDAPDLLGPLQRHAVTWEREATISTWLTDIRSRSYIAALDGSTRDELLTTVAGSLAPAFPDGRRHIPYETVLWTARRLPD